jgi:small subunit ribosomal protein S6
MDDEGHSTTHETLLSRNDRDREDQRRWVMSLRQYEIMIILDPEIEERTVAPSLDKYLSVVKNDGGSVDKVDIWGRRRLAYDIKKKSEGIYAVVNFSAEPATAKELDRQLGLNEVVLRTKVLRADA